MQRRTLQIKIKQICQSLMKNLQQYYLASESEEISNVIQRSSITKFYNKYLIERLKMRWKVFQYRTQKVKKFQRGIQNVNMESNIMNICYQMSDKNLKRFVLEQQCKQTKKIDYAYYRTDEIYTQIIKNNDKIIVLLQQLKEQMFYFKSSTEESQIAKKNFPFNYQIQNYFVSNLKIEFRRKSYLILNDCSKIVKQNQTNYKNILIKILYPKTNQFY
ncbi:unnamed protein product [Paramecium octaurelia]|uniref:Uncharacterized protein n=1 Tax=Paramecium octaurelia TaxID=43137 RepID=A0A8S1TLD1_PAROT|nr:unnamed protein product [Paramecium octaurelia]